MKWYEQEAPHQDIVISSRIRLARNLCEFPFQGKMTDAHRKALVEKIRKALQAVKIDDTPLQYIDMGELDEYKRYGMVERHTVSTEFVKSPRNRMLVLSEDESIAVMVNEEDHLRIQVMANGLNLEKAFWACSSIDDTLEQQVEYAFDEKLGFLTTCPTNLGTGLRASVMVHLPALEHAGLMSQLTATINKLGLTIRGTYGEGSKVLGSIYQISNQITLGITELDAIQNLESVVLQIIDSEKNARENLMKNRYQMEDTVYRSYGILSSARLLTSKEFFEESSNVRLGVSMGLIENVSVPKLNRMMNQSGTATICEEKGREIPPQERDYLRAKMIRSELLPDKEKH